MYSLGVQRDALAMDNMCGGLNVDATSSGGTPQCCEDS